MTNAEMSAEEMRARCLKAVEDIEFYGAEGVHALILAAKAINNIPAKTSLSSAPSSNGMREALERAPDPAFYKPDEFFKPYTIWFEQTRAAALRALPPATASSREGR